MRPREGPGGYINKNLFTWEVLLYYSFSHGCCRDSSLNEGASGEKEKLLALPKPPSQREVASRSDDGRSFIRIGEIIVYDKS